jgi:hypothetical protein
MSMKNTASERTPSDTFSLELYEETLKKAKDLGYEFPTVSELKEGFGNRRRFLLLRHDIDSSPHYALQMAKLEHRLGVRSSYFVLMHSLHYNPAAPPHWDELREIIDMNFEVGLHYDTSFFEERHLDLLEGVRSDAAALEKILGISIVSVSQHRPASSPFLKKLNEYYVDAYNNELVNDVLYVSDSGFKWRGKSLIDYVGTEDRIHALIHPLTWSFGDLDMTGTYRRISNELESQIRDSFNGFIASTDEYLRDRDRLDKVRKARYDESSDG